MAPNGDTLLVNVQGHEGEYMKFSAQKDDKVWKIQEQIQSETKVSVENQKLFLGSETLNPEKKLSDYGIDQSTTIHLILKVVKPSDEEQMVPQVEVDNGKKDPVHIKPSGSVSQVKEVNVQSQGQEPMEICAKKDDGVMKMSTKTEGNVKNQVFLPGSKDGNPGNILAKSVWNLGCLMQSAMSFLNLVTEERSPQVDTQVNVCFKGQEPMKISSQQNDRIKKIIEEITTKTKVPVEKQVSLSDSKTLNPPQKLSDNCLDPSPPIHLKQNPSDEEVQVIFHETRIGKKHILLVRPSTSVSEFIELIKSKAIVPPKGRVMYFNDKALQHGKVMSDYLRPECNVLYSHDGCIGG